MSSPPSIHALARALGASGDLIAAVREDQWSNASPCPEFTARGLVNHLVVGSRLFAGIVHAPAIDRLAAFLGRAVT